MSKIYLIYDRETLEVWEYFPNEEQCETRFKYGYKGFVNMDWTCVNFDDMFSLYVKFYGLR